MRHRPSFPQCFCVRGFQHDCLCEQALKTPFGSFSLLSQRLRSSSASRQPSLWNLLSPQTQSQRPRSPSRSPRTNTISQQCQSLTIHHRYCCLLLVASSLSMTLNTIEPLNTHTQHTLPRKARTHQNSFTTLLTRDPAGAVVPAASPPGSPAEAQPRKHRLDSAACPQSSSHPSPSEAWAQWLQRPVGLQELLLQEVQLWLLWLML